MWNKFNFNKFNIAVEEIRDIIKSFFNKINKHRNIPSHTFLDFYNVLVHAGFVSGKIKLDI